MLKTLLLIITIVLCSYNLFSQRLCEETLYTAGLHKSVNPDEIIIKGNNKLYWYNVENCEFVDTLDPKVGSAGFKISLNADCVILTSFNPNIPLEFVKYDLLTKEKVDGFNITTKSEYAVDLAINDYTNSFYILSDNDNKITEYNLETGEVLRSVSTPSHGLSDIKVSPSGNLIGVYSPWKDFGNILHIYNAHTLEFIRSINFRDYFEEGNIEGGSNFNFDPISDDVYIGCNVSIVKINPFTLEKTDIITNQYINVSSIEVSENRDKLFTGIWDGSTFETAVVALDQNNEITRLDEYPQLILPFDEFIIVANSKTKNNIVKLSLVTNIDESEEIQLSVFPNPNSGSLNVSFQNSQPSQIQIKLFNIQGELIQFFYDELYTEPLFTMAFDISNNPNGSYLLEIRIGENEYVENIILEK